MIIDIITMNDLMANLINARTYTSIYEQNLYSLLILFKILYISIYTDNKIKNPVKC